MDFLLIPHGSGGKRILPPFATSLIRKQAFARGSVAPAVGLEPTTNSLHRSSHYWKGWTISSPVLGARGFVPT